MKIIKITLLFLFVCSFLLVSCKKTNVAPDQNTQVKNTISGLMQEWYLWRDKLPTSIDVNKYADANVMIDSLIYKKYDKWTYLTDSYTYNQYFQAGQYIGHGFGSKLDASNQLWVTFVYKNSPAEVAGFTRGCQILKINGRNVSDITDFSNVYGASTAGISNSFQFKDVNGNIKDVTMTKAAIDINSVIYREVKTVNNQKVGYLVFNSFIGTSNTEIDEAFTYFQSQGVTELILDLRYNGGGLISVSQYLSSIIAGPNNTGKAFISYQHNANKSSENKTLVFNSPKYTFNFNRVICITSKATASASELVINGLKPYLNVLLVGDDTYGKPVGAYGFDFSGYVLNLISLRLVNAAGNTDYFNGLPANAKQRDGLEKNWGDETEPCLAEALYYIKNGAFSGQVLLKTSTANTQSPMFDHPFKEEIGAY